MRDGLGNRESRTNECDDITRAHLISKANVSDIKRHLKYNRRLHPDDSVSTYYLVKRLEKEEYNCVIVYKPQGEKTEIGPMTYNEIDLKNDLFVIGRSESEDINWVQCTACPQWFHCCCLNMSLADADEAVSFRCP